MSRDLIPPWGHTLLHGEAGKPTSAVGLASPKAVPRRGGGLTFGRRPRQRAGWRLTAGWFRRRAGQPSGVRAFGRRTAGGSGRGRAKKSRTRGGFRGPRGVRGRQGPGQNRGKTGLHPGARRAKKRAEPGQNGAFGRAKRRVRRALGAKKPLFAAKKAGNGAVLGRKLAEKAGGACRVIWHLQGIFGRFRRKKLGASKKPFHAHIGRNRFLPLFFVDGAPSLGRIIWWFGRVAIWAGKSDECVTPRGTPHGKRKKEATP